nr:pirin family protein [uncultured Psychrobacter sp.]
MKTIHHPANKRGGSYQGWLKSKHNFSFGDYYDRARVGFGALKVINDDHIEGGHGLSSHSHRNMEIVSIPLSGTLLHKDNMGNESIIKSGEIQIMSAGTGVVHSESNVSLDIPVKFLQIWLEPNKKNVTPRYQQVSIIDLLKHNQFAQVLSPNADDAGLWIYQEAWFSVGEFDAGVTKTYALNDTSSGAYVFMISGSVIIDGTVLQPRDGLGITETDKFAMDVISKAQVLVMEVPVR